VSGGGGLPGVDVADNDEVDVDLFLSVGRRVKRGRGRG